MESIQPRDTVEVAAEPQKRPRNNNLDTRYPRKRSSKACHVCRARKTKCDNVRPACGFCVSVNISCSYDDAEKEHSSFDPASLEILRHLSRITSSQEDILQTVRANSTTQPNYPVPDASSVSGRHFPLGVDDDTRVWSSHDSAPQENHYPEYDWFAPHSESTATSPAASTGVAAFQWFGLLTRDTSLEFQDDARSTLEGGSLDPFNGHGGNATTPLQQATKIIDDQPAAEMTSSNGNAEEAMWQAPQCNVLLEHEQILYSTFLHRLCSWIDLFDTVRKFSTTVPRLATRNAGLLNAIFALAGYHQSLDESIPSEKRTNQNSALQYYYQTLHYVQKAMRYSSYQHSLELMATTLIISAYEMLRGSRKDWQQHLQGVFWILRSRQIEVETSSLESTTWWAWLRQDIWVAFREKRRTYSTWVPKKIILRA